MYLNKLMKPGRELDALIAEKIFGAKLLRCKKQSGGYQSFVFDKNLNNFEHPAVQDRMIGEDFFDVRLLFPKRLADAAEKVAAPQLGGMLKNWRSGLLV